MHGYAKRAISDFFPPPSRKGAIVDQQ